MKSKEVHMRGKNLVTSTTGVEYEIPGLLNIEKTKNMKKRIKSLKGKRSTYNYDQHCQVHDEYEDGSHSEPISLIDYRPISPIDYVNKITDSQRLYAVCY